MNQEESQVIKRVKNLIWAAILILIAGEIGYLLQSTVSYLLGLMFAVMLFLLHWYTRKHTNLHRWEKMLSMALPIISILGPIIYIFLQLFVFQSSGFLFKTAVWFCFIIPLGLLFYANHLISKAMVKAHID